MDDPQIAGLLRKAEVLQLTKLSYTTLWQWMREGKFPRAREVGARTMWLASEVDDWIQNRPVRPLKGDQGRAA